MLQVAVPALSVVLEEVHDVAPPVPLTVHVTVPVGVVAPSGPDTVAVKVTLLPSPEGVVFVTISNAAPLTTVYVVEAVTPLVSVAVTALAPVVTLGTVKVV